MTDQDRVTGRTLSATAGRNVVPEPRRPGERGQFGELPALSGSRAGSRLRVDARRNLESVLRAAREVFGELGYGAPMEEVARRAGVGVGTVYRRFPSKEVLIQRIAAEEVGWLTVQARESLHGGAGAWESLSGFLLRAAGSGAGRLLPPEAFRYAEEICRVPEQRDSQLRGAKSPTRGSFEPAASRRAAATDADPRLLLELVAALVARAGAAGELRPGVTVLDVVLVLTAAVPVQAAEILGAGQPADAPGERLLQILLYGLRAR